MGTDASAPSIQGAAMTDVLRPYQQTVVGDVERAIAAGKRRILLVAPTGSGKTVIASTIIDQFTRHYRPALVLAHRLEIIGQTSKKLYACQISHGIIKAGFPPRPMERVQVASVATLWVRAALGHNAVAAGGPAHRRRSSPRNGDDLAQNHRCLSRRGPHRTDRHAMSRRRTRARWHL